LVSPLTSLSRNTCTVTGRSTPAAGRRCDVPGGCPGATVIAAGVRAGAPDVVAGMDGVDLVVETGRRRLRFPRRGGPALRRARRRRNAGAAGLPVVHAVARVPGHTRAFEDPGRLRRPLRLLHRPAGARPNRSPPPGRPEQVATPPAPVTGRWCSRRAPWHLDAT
jgi:hypothetical protein